MSTAAWNLAALAKPTKRRTQRSSTSETRSIVTPALKALEAFGSDVHAERRNAGNVSVYVRGGKKGTPDIMGACWNKRLKRAFHFAIECKKPGEKARPEQTEWYQAHGHLYEYLIAYNVEDVVEFVKGLMR